MDGVYVAFGRVILDDPHNRILFTRMFTNHDDGWSATTLTIDDCGELDGYGNAMVVSSSSIWSSSTISSMEPMRKRHKQSEINDRMIPSINTLASPS